MKIRLRITRQLIGRGMRGHPTWNPLALSMTAAGLYDAEATQSVMRWRGRRGERHRELATPGHVAAWLALYGMGGEVRPFEYDLEVFDG